MIADGLIRAKRRGVDVKVVVDMEQAGHTGAATKSLYVLTFESTVKEKDK